VSDAAIRGDAAWLRSRKTARCAGLLLQREVNVAGPIEIFAYLDRRLQFGGEPG
jgi:hypothetical protein